MTTDHPLRDLNTWGVGGTCSIFEAPATAEEARSAVAASSKRDLPLYVLGGGSNVLVSDGPIRAAVIHTGRLDLIKIRESSDGRSAEIEAGAGVPVKKLLSVAMSEGLGGLEFLTGIPGTLGGAIWGNAGADGAGFGGLVREASAIGRDGLEMKLSQSDFSWKYRTCPLDESRTALITSCVISLKRESRSDIFDRIKKYAAMKKGQPLGKKTAGCVFKNPEGTSAGLLLDRSGCKGMRVGGAVVSASHANFIENEGNATSRDIFELCELCRETVYRDHGVYLEYEIKFLGSFKKD
ncbi:MAG TPA: UDP-N-acetylmuramate dehydrogenase [Synergistaceae bacterium]|nr:UDP-N-acetylmuramate dehydrogenase [Synergistaceae bacterium]NLL40213.1 UDP-N-acetylmuramate dehydrogenase [Synergistaceae bacterium]HPX03501.1 UDP-N-acetylmuramate dehydrogenase [Synergistaceae bacterium]HQA54367.1 UDP-N-acetylmuramate dehydrogenase [Synergistaceae bacterium]